MHDAQKMVEVFQTNIRTKSKARKIKAALLLLMPNARISFDLEDCDHILRIENESIATAFLLELLISEKVTAQVLQ